MEMEIIGGSYEGFYIIYNSNLKDPHITFTSIVHYNKWDVF